MTHMQLNFMYGEAQPVEVDVMTVLLIGFDGRRLELTGTREVLWREFMHGDGGKSEFNKGSKGYEYWCPQPILTLTPKEDY